MTRQGKPTTADRRAHMKWIGRWDPERFDRDRVAEHFDRPKARNSAGG